jgi:predicted dehydrogenase
MSRHGTHIIDLYRWFFGEPVDVSGRSIAPLDRGQNEEMSIIVQKYANDLLTELTVSVLFSGDNVLEIYGEEGVLIAPNVFQYSLEPSRITLNGKPVQYEPNDAFFELVSDFINSVISKKAPQVGLKDGVENVRIMETALRPCPEL